MQLERCGVRPLNSKKNLRVKRILIVERDFRKNVRELKKRANDRKYDKNHVELRGE